MINQLILEEGKSYLRHDGKITEKLVLTENELFFDIKFHELYNKHGEVIVDGLPFKDLDETIFSESKNDDSTNSTESRKAYLCPCSNCQSSRKMIDDGIDTFVISTLKRLQDSFIKGCKDKIAESKTPEIAYDYALIIEAIGEEYPDFKILNVMVQRFLIYNYIKMHHVKFDTVTNELLTKDEYDEFFGKDSPENFSSLYLRIYKKLEQIVVERTKPDATIFDVLMIFLNLAKDISNPILGILPKDIVDAEGKVKHIHFKSTQPFSDFEALTKLNVTEEELKNMKQQLITDIKKITNDVLLTKRINLVISVKDWQNQSYYELTNLHKIFTNGINELPFNEEEEILDAEIMGITVPGNVPKERIKDFIESKINQVKEERKEDDEHMFIQMSDYRKHLNHDLKYQWIMNEYLEKEFLMVKATDYKSLMYGIQLFNEKYPNELFEILHFLDFIWISKPNVIGNEGEL